MLHGGLGQPLRSQKGEKDPVIQCEERQSPGPRGEKELGVCSGQRGGSTASAGEGRIDQEGRQRHTPEGVGRREVSRPGSHTTCLVLERSFWLSAICIQLFTMINKTVANLKLHLSTSLIVCLGHICWAGSWGQKMGSWKAFNFHCQISF